ncbi:MAG TPA: bifunctional demethylmenaquinone methyltransferase/2-methoxy-6-polyprenyl-1,4-benzoquinol methylase UbiE [Euryarchaeota archaeon]|nr:bifunctional demethylmenaquinone methyltransferase/2-methoxy-6-polyprenyl-1,4-benzoquinol methylase UbiE [Euryarchaeota archaeon]
MPSGVREKTVKINRMFSSIADRYDLANTLLSFNTDTFWRRFAVEKTGVTSGNKVLDVATGTGKIAFQLEKKVGVAGFVAGVDFNEEMLKIAKTRAENRRVAFLRQDALRLAFRDNSFDAVTVGFGVRNMASVERAVAEMARVVRKGGRVVILEFTMPRNKIIRALYSFYFFNILPLLGGVIAGDRDAYSYLPESVEAFPKPMELMKIMEKLGMDVEYNLLTFGTVAVHVGVKK